MTKRSKEAIAQRRQALLSAAQTPRFPSVFISYCRKDKAIAKALADDLSAAGVPVCASCGGKLHGVAALIHEGTFAEGHKTNEVPIELTFAEIVHAEGQ